jgi:hypothetical protein
MFSSPSVFVGRFVHQACWFACLCGEFPGELHRQNTRIRDTVFPLLKQCEHQGMPVEESGRFRNGPAVAGNVDVNHSVAGAG